MMAGDGQTVAGRRFRTKADYEAALRDQQKIEEIRKRTDLNDPKQIYALFGELQGGVYHFESIVGTDFDDEVYEKVEELKKQGITPENAGKSFRSRRKAGKRPHKDKADGHGKKKMPEQSHRLEEYDKEMQEQILGELKRQERKRRGIVLLASVVAVLCFGYFGIYYYFSARTSAEYSELAALKGSSALSESQSAEKFALHKSSVKLPDVLDEYKTLYQKNKKLIGWIKIDDTLIDYPVMQTSDNEYYLDHNFNQEQDNNGSLFLDCDCSPYPQSTNLIIYGHHMKSGQMFGGLQKYAKESYGKKHSVIQFDTIYEKGTYEVMYVFRSQVYNENDIVFKYYQFIEANSKEEFDSYMKEMEAVSLYDMGVTASFGDHILTLSTCDYSQEDGRFVVVAKKIK